MASSTKGPVFHRDLLQGSEEWLAARCGLLTASEMKLIITPTLKVASNDAERTHLYELLAQRITRYVEPAYVSYDMLRGQDDEVFARQHYEEEYAPVDQVGFITNDKWGFTIGYSPDGLVGRDGQIEVKSRAQKHQIRTVLEDGMPADFLIQVQTGLLVSERKWCDFISYSGGLPMVVYRVEACATVQEVIVEAATQFEARLAKAWEQYKDNLTRTRHIKTERRIIEEIVA